MRNLHRWVMTVVVVLMLYWAVSGLILALYDYADNSQAYAFDGGGVGTARAGRALGQLPPEQMSGLIDGALSALRRTAPTAALRSAELRLVAGKPVALFVADDSAQTRWAFDPATGASLPYPGDEPVSLHQAIKTWHRGNVAGLTGQILALVVAAALAFLTLTGIVLYVQMLRQRQRLGRRAWFWS